MPTLSVGQLTGLGMLVGFIFVVIVALYVLVSYSIMVIARKTGTPHAWLAWIPVANFFLLVSIARLPIWYGFIPIILQALSGGFRNERQGLSLISVLVAAFSAYVWMKISERRNHPWWVGLIALIPFGNIGVPVYLAFWDAKPAVGPVDAAQQPAVPPSTSNTI